MLIERFKFTETKPPFLNLKFGFRDKHFGLSSKAIQWQWAI